MYRIRPLIITAVLLGGSPALAAPDWLALDGGSPGAQGVSIEVEAGSAPAALELRADFRGVWLESVFTEAGEFTRVDLTGGAGAGAVGTPRLPVVRRRVAVPYGNQVAVYATGFDPVSIDLPAPLVPAQPAQRKCDPPAPFAYSPKAYMAPRPPPALARIVDEQIMRGVRHVIVELRPATYDPVGDTLTLFRRIDFTVVTAKPRLDYTRQVWRRTLPGQQRLVGAQLLGLERIRGEGKAGALPDVPIHYVFVLPDHSEPGFTAALQPLVEWKREKGFVVTELFTSSVGSTKEAIKAALRQLYENPLPDEGVPVYATLVGDVQHVPYWEGTGDGENQAADQYYGTMDAPDSNYTADQVPDFHVGRLSVATPTELANVVRKTLAHEIPTDPSAAWYSNSLWVASADHSALGRETHEWVAPGFSGAGMSITNAFEDQVGATTALQIAEDGIEVGQSIINYSGHGFHQGWVCVPVEDTYVLALTDIGAYPFVITNACQCGQFQHNSQGDCFSESWLKADGGAVASWAASNNSLWDEDDLIEKAVWAAFFPSLRGRGDDPHVAGYAWPAAEAFTTVGAITDLGLQLFYERADASWSVQYAVEEYNLLGDPSVDLWTTQPLTVELLAPSAVILGQSSITLEVSTAATPYEGALVAIQKAGEVSRAGYTDAFGSVNLPLTGLLTPGDLHVVVTGHNLSPALDDLPVIPPGGAYVGVVDRTWDDGGAPPSTGNGNGQPSPGELLTLDLLLKNFGDEDATTVVATLAATDACVTLDDDQVVYGTLAPNDESLGDGPFQVSINSCANDHRVDFTITITSDQDTWVESLYFVVGNAIAGSVLVEATGAPAVDATITFVGPSEGSQGVEADGGFVLQGLEPGDYVVTAEHPDYVSESTNVTVPATEPVALLLGRPEISVIPTSIEATANLQSGSPDVPLTILNDGDRDLTYEVVTRYGNGDDAFGYRWADSDSGEISLDWRELPAAARQSLNLDDDDDALVSLPAPFEFYGQSFTTVRMGSNGYLNFGASDPWVPWDTGPLPNAEFPSGLLAVFYRDMDPSSGGQTYWGVDDGDVVFTWDAVPEFDYGGTPPVHTFQVVLQSTGGILFNYASATGGGPIVGIQNLNATQGMNVGDGVHDDLTIAIATEVPWILLADGAGVAGPASSGVATLSFDLSLLSVGTHNALVRVVSNDIHAPFLLVPLTLEVVDFPDADGDGFDDAIDNCPDQYNPLQEDLDGNGIGDLCEIDCSVDPCDDANPCTDDTCGADNRCRFTPRTGSCDDGSDCTTGDTCVDAQCVGNPVDCDDSNPCTEDYCRPDGGCANVPQEGPCDDGDACTFGDACLLGTCTGTPLECNDGNPCTDDLCAADGSCDFVPNDATCDDGNPCTDNACVAGECRIVELIEDCCPPWATDCCEPQAEQRCEAGDLVWVDSCGEVEEVIADCGERGCADGACCAEGEIESDGACVEDDGGGGDPSGCGCSGGGPAPAGSLLALLALALVGRRRLRG